eukprot:CAMPEP_0198278086 /NCGR_PEP_ID=MMETSP1447-20131203/66197_1 /TAXON_ID=420782 /ORGANISM="Chaetoceros dichaeta, Strain CCMP1751" /LENGTH=314 /DNA_ID=CAMNT_0043973155 /DNA_START=76 /DNA_END=1021 /DNA_ORIENTATION=+
MSLEFCSVRYYERIKHSYDGESACKGKNPLIQLIADNDWENALLQIDEDNAKTWSLNPSLVSSDPQSDVFQTHRGCRKSSVLILPIHQACTQLNVEVSLVESLVAAYPESLHMCDSADMRTPLHLALLTGASEDIIFHLIEKGYSATSVQDYWGRVPLHYACATDSSVAVIKKLLLLCPETIRATDVMDMTPLHEPLFTLVCPETIRATDVMDMTPLHVASFHSRSTEAIDTMLSISPEAIFMITKKGETAIDLAKGNESQARDLILTLLYEVRKIHGTPTFQNEREAYERISDDCSTYTDDNDIDSLRQPDLI